MVFSSWRVDSRTLLLVMRTILRCAAPIRILRLVAACCASAIMVNGDLNRCMVQ